MISRLPTVIYFDPDVYEALRLKSALLDVSVSALVSRAVKQLLAEDIEDQAAIDGRRTEADLDFEDVVDALRESGKL